ncbi:MAG TPA: serpin family protein [Xanthomonadales bacterium]|nr:serpin family protein [Xanthomonadales bacterium]
MSDSARRQRRAASESDCRPQPAYIARSIWFSRTLPPDPRAAPLLRPHAELHVERGYVNDGVARWLQAHRALPLPLRRPVFFAAVSALDYARSWEYPFTLTQPTPFVFHGKKRDARVRFLAGRQLASIGDRSCVRGVMLLHEGGAVFVTAIGSAPVSAAVRCLSRALDPKTLVDAHFFIPELKLRRTGSIVDRLVRLGLTDVFDGRTNPFPKLFRRGVDEAIQAAELTMDWKGIHVSATTSFSITLSGPRFAAVLAYDHPFAMRVIDERGTTVAIALVNDL